MRTARGTGESGASLLEALVSLALGLMVMVTALPLLSWSRAMAVAVSRRAAWVDGARLGGHRLLQDTRRAGFGLEPGAVALSVGSAGITVEHTEGGFGGLRVMQTAPPGERWLTLAAVHTLRSGDSIIVHDTWGRFLRTRLRAIDTAGRRVELETALPFAAGPATGTRLFRIVRQQWELRADGLRRNGSPVIDNPVTLTLARAVAGTPLAWLQSIALAPGPTVPGSEDLLLARLVVGRNMSSEPLPAMRSRAGVVPVAARPRIAAAARASGSPLP